MDRQTRGTGSDCDLEDAADDEDDADAADGDEGKVPNESHEVLLTLAVAGKSESFLLRVSACNSLGESTSMGGVMTPGEVHLLSASSQSASLRDQRELESSHKEPASSVSVKSDATDRVGLVGLRTSSSSIASGMEVSVGSSWTTALAEEDSIRAGAGSSRRTLASSTVSSAAPEHEDARAQGEERDELRRGFLL